MATAEIRPRRDPVRREAILHAAAEVFAHAGFAATSVEDIAAAAGITKLIVYRHFDSKENLYRAVLERVFQRQAELFLANLAQGLQAAGTTRALLTVAREWPDGFRLVWRHAAREPQFAEDALHFRDAAVNAAVIRDGRSIAADCSGVLPSSFMCRSTFSTTMIASSTTRPIASTSASSVNRFIE